MQLSGEMAILFRTNCDIMICPACNYKSAIILLSDNDKSELWAELPTIGLLNELFILEQTFQPITRVKIRKKFTWDKMPKKDMKIKLKCCNYMMPQVCGSFYRQKKMNCGQNVELLKSFKCLTKNRGEKT